MGQSAHERAAPVDLHRWVPGRDRRHPRVGGGRHRDRHRRQRSRRDVRHGRCRSIRIRGSDPVGDRGRRRRAHLRVRWTADGTASGCRFDRTGTRDPGSNGGRAALSVRWFTPDATRRRSSMAGSSFAATRQVDGLDCDRIPTLVELDVTTGRPVTSFGAGGLTLHAAVGKVAAIVRNGSVYSLERRDIQAPRCAFVEPTRADGSRTSSTFPCRAASSAKISGRSGH